MAGFVGHLDRSVAVSGVDQNSADLGMAVDIVRGALVAFGDRDRASRADDIFHEKGRFRHHRAPAGLVPADRAVFEDHLKLAVIVHIRRNLVERRSPIPWTRTGAASVIWHMTST